MKYSMRTNPDGGHSKFNRLSDAIEAAKKAHAQGKHAVVHQIADHKVMFNSSILDTTPSHDLTHWIMIKLGEMADSRTARREDNTIFLELIDGSWYSITVAPLA